jgi:hypothetical protein
VPETIATAGRKSFLARSILTIGAISALEGSAAKTREAG